MHTTKVIGNQPYELKDGPEHWDKVRPVPGWVQHRMPITGFYQTGATTHPGESVSGGPGRNAAAVMPKDFGSSLEEIVPIRERRGHRTAGGEAFGDAAGPALPTASTSHLRQLTKINLGEFPSSDRWAVLQFVAPALAHGSSDMPVWGNLFGSLDPRIRMIR